MVIGIRRFLKTLCIFGLLALTLTACRTAPARPPVPHAPRVGYQWRWDGATRAWMEVSEDQLAQERLAEQERQRQAQAAAAERQRLQREAALERRRYAVWRRFRR